MNAKEVTVAAPEPALSRKKRAITFGLALLAFAAGGLGTPVIRRFFTPQKAPRLSYTNLRGEQISAESLQGKVVLVNFWATSCAICVAEMPAMAATFLQYQAQGLEMLAIAMQYDPPNYVLNFAQTRHLPFPVVLDVRGDLARAYGEVQATPTTFVIDRQGTIVKRYVGAPDFPSLHRELELVLASTS